MKFKAENPNKVRNIVEPNFEYFMDYYEDVINRFEKEKIIEYNDNSIFNIRGSKFILLTIRQRNLPKTLRLHPRQK